MANANSPYGFKLIEPGTDCVTIPCLVPSSSSAVLGYGDPVVFTTLTNGAPTVVRATADGGIHGIVINPLYPMNSTTGYNPLNTDRRRPASVLNAVEVLLCKPGDGKIFSIQSDGALSATQSNLFFNMATVGNANAYTALSTVQLGAASVSATVGDLLLLGLDPWYASSQGLGTSDQNDITAAYCKVLVQINNT